MAADLVSRSVAQRLGRRSLILGAAGAAGGLLVGGWRGEGSAPTAASSSGPKLTGTLNLYSWAEYTNPADVSAFSDDTPWL